MRYVAIPFKRATFWHRIGVVALFANKEKCDIIFEIIYFLRVESVRGGIL